MQANHHSQSKWWGMAVERLEVLFFLLKLAGFQQKRGWRFKEDGHLDVDADADGNENLLRFTEKTF
jgi:hypothetical protein